MRKGYNVQPRCATLIVMCLPMLAQQNACGAFSAFVRITPETEAEHHMHLQILPIEGQESVCRLLPPQAPAYMRAYLITCRENVPPERQVFRDYIWSGGKGRKDVLSVAPLLPYELGHFECGRFTVSDRSNNIVLDRSLLGRTYIYIDYPHMVSDGGYCYCVDLSAYPLPEERTMRMHYSPAKGLSPEPGVMRRDPSDIIKVADLYYVWYTRSNVAHGYDATVWYATSLDGHTWTEKGEALARGRKGTWDEQSVFTPNILKVKRKYYLFYTGAPKPFSNEGNKVTETAIGVAIADSPDGPWQKLAANPVLRPSQKRWLWLNAPFDSMRVDDACLLVRDGKYWLYYKGRRWNDTPAHTEMGLAVAEQPEGPYVRFGPSRVDKERQGPVVKGGHEVLVWPVGHGVAAMVNIGPEGIAETLQYAPDGLSFSRMMDLDEVPNAPGAYRPEAFTESGEGQMIEWGLHVGSAPGSLPFLERFDCQW